MATMDPRIVRILGKLEEVRGRRIDTFGAQTHRFTLAAPLTEEAVAALETEHDLELPEDFRTFLLQAGASGAGPYYGILPPASWRDAGQDDAITLVDQGCAYYGVLVIAGPERGRVRYISGDGGKPFLVESSDFLTWYERWLDELLMGFDHSWFGTQMAGDEKTFVAIARDASHPKRRQALAAMWQLPALSPEAQETVALRVRDSDPEIRVTALNLAVAKKAVAAIEVHVRRALADESSQVRTSAIDALVALDVPWHDDVRPLLSDSSPNVVLGAAQALHRKKALSETELTALLVHTEARVRNNALEFARMQYSQAIFDALLALPPTDDPYDRRLQALIAQVSDEKLDEAHRRTVLACVNERLAVVTSKPPTAAIAGLRILSADLPEAFANLLELTRHAEPFWRYEAAAALGTLGHPAARPALEALISDRAMPRADGMSTAWSVGESAKRALAKLRTVE